MNVSVARFSKGQGSDCIDTRAYFILWSPPFVGCGSVKFTLEKVFVGENREVLSVVEERLVIDVYLTNMSTCEVCSGTR